MANYDESLNQLNKARYALEEKENEFNVAREEHIENLVRLSTTEILSILNEYHELSERDLRLVLTDLVRKTNDI